MQLAKPKRNLNKSTLSQPTNNTSTLSQPPVLRLRNVEDAAESEEAEPTNGRQLSATTPRIRKRQRYSAEAENMAQLSNAMKTMSECRKNLAVEDDSEAFGNLLATMTRRLDAQDRIHLHLRLMTIVAEYFAGPPASDPRVSIGSRPGTSGVSSTPATSENMPAPFFPTQTTASTEGTSGVCGY